MSIIFAWFCLGFWTKSYDILMNYSQTSDLKFLLYNFLIFFPEGPRFSSHERWNLGISYTTVSSKIQKKIANRSVTFEFIFKSVLKFFPSYASFMSCPCPPHTQYVSLHPPRVMRTAWEFCAILEILDHYLDFSHNFSEVSTNFFIFPKHFINS